MAQINVGTSLERGETFPALVAQGTNVLVANAAILAISYQSTIGFTASNIQCSAAVSAPITSVASLSNWTSTPPTTYPATVGTADRLLAGYASTPLSTSAFTLNYTLHQIAATAASTPPSTSVANARTVFTINTVAASTPVQSDPNGIGVDIALRAVIGTTSTPVDTFDATIYLGSIINGVAASTAPSTESAGIGFAPGLTRTIELSPVTSTAEVELTPTLALVSTKATAADFVDQYDIQRLLPLPVDVGGTTYQWSATAEGRIRLHDLADNIEKWEQSKSGGNTPLVFDDGTVATFTDAPIAELREQYDTQLRARLDTLNNFLHGVIASGDIPLTSVQADGYWPTLDYRVMTKAAVTPHSVADATIA